MNRYRSLWATLASTVLILGLTVSIVLVPLADILEIGLSTAVGLPLVVTALYNTYTPVNTRRLTTRDLVIVGTAGGPVAVALVGLFLLNPVGAVLLSCGLFVTHPSISDYVARRIGKTRSATANKSKSVGEDGTPAPAVTYPNLVSLSDHELCFRWRLSYNGLARVRTTAELLALDQARGAILDEIARRFPVGFARWLDSGARAASDPSRYLIRPDRSDSTS